MTTPIHLTDEQIRELKRTIKQETTDQKTVISNAASRLRPEIEGLGRITMQDVRTALGTYMPAPIPIPALEENDEHHPKLR